MRLITCHAGHLQALLPGELPASKSFTTGLAALDGLLPGGGFARGAVHEILSPAGGATLFFALLLARSAAQERRMENRGWKMEERTAFVHSPSSRAIVWCDPDRTLYAPALASAGVALERLYLLRPKNAADAVWALAECLRCRGVAAAVAAPPRLSRVEARRLQLAAERGGGIGLLLRGAGEASAPYAAATRWLVAPVQGERTVQRWKLQLLHCHGGSIGKTIILEHSRETNSVRAADELVHREAPAAGDRRATA